jgi:hypothetical protein
MAEAEAAKAAMAAIVNCILMVLGWCWGGGGGGLVEMRRIKLLGWLLKRV